MLLKFRELIVLKDVDFLVTYNGVNFDNLFLAERAAAGRASRGRLDEFFFLSRFSLRPTKLRELSLNSAGMGNNLLRYFDTVGRENLDWYIKLKRDLPSEMSHKLGAMAAKFCNNDAKEDMDYREIPILQAGTDADRARLASYCVHDSVLLARLNTARAMLLEILQFATVFRIPPHWVYFRGQQVRFVTQLADKARRTERLPMLLNHPSLGFSDVGQGTYEGATVNEPKRGFYRKPVATLDWKSLYPSIMIAHNLCPSTLVRDPAMFGAEGVVEHAIGDGVSFHFTSRQRHQGLLPRIAQELLHERALAKKEMKAHLKRSKQEDLDEATRAMHALLADVCDGKQLALKVSCNSLYGALGASEEKGAPFPCMAVSAATTARGREAMVIKKQILPERFPGVDIIYGDSVASDTPLLLRLGGTRITMMTVEELGPAGDAGAEVADFAGRRLSDKEAVVLAGVETFTEVGWTPAPTLIRHAVSKPMYRVSTRTATVDVTEDHSLLRADGMPCTPRECMAEQGKKDQGAKGGTALLHAWPSPDLASPDPLNDQARHRAWRLGYARGGDAAGRGRRGAPSSSPSSSNPKRVPDSILNGGAEVRRVFLEGARCDGADVVDAHRLHDAARWRGRRGLSTCSAPWRSTRSSPRRSSRGDPRTGWSGRTRSPSDDAPSTR